jgi:hypothetical protein
VTIAGQALLIEDQRGDRHDGHHHQGKRQERGAGSHEAEPAATWGPSAIFRPLSRA